MLLTLTALAAVGPLAAQDVFVETRRMVPPLPYQWFDVTGTADFDLDGDLDILVLVGLDAADAVLENLDHGLFERDAGSVPVNDERSSDLVLGDLDGDGDADAVFLGYAAPTRVYRNDAGTFVEAQDLGQLALNESYGALGDLDNDGDLDLFAGASFGEGLFVFRNSAGVFSPTSSSFVPNVLADCNDVELADLNGDGDLDAYVASWAFSGYSTDFVALGDNGAKFEQQVVLVPNSTLDVALADLDEDGDVDAYLADGYDDDIAWNDGSAAFTVTVGPLSIGSILVSLEDFNGDAMVDILTASGEGTHHLHGQGGGAFVDVTTSTLPVHVVFNSFTHGDFDGDADRDIFGVSFWGPLENLWLNDGSGAFGEAQSTTTGVGSYHGHGSTSVGDVNADGFPDVLTTLSTFFIPESADLYLGGPDGQLNFAPNQLPPTFLTSATHGALVDLDGDGDDDALVGSTHGATVHLNDGTGIFTELPDAAGAGFDHVVDLAVGDIDGDGDPDAVLAEALWYPSASVFVNDGTGRFQKSVDLADPTTAIYYGVELFDGDGDGDLDLVLAGTLTLYLANDGLGNFTEVPGSLDDGYYEDVSSGDVDGDGDVDVLLIVGGSGSTLMRNDGTGMFTPSTGWTDNALWNHSAVFADVDGDSDLDLVVALANDPTGTDVENRIFWNDGTGTFDTSETFGSYPAVAPVFVDFDLDGDLDLLPTGWLNVMTNVRGGQVARRTLPRIGKPLLMEVFGEPGTPFTLALSTGTFDFPVPGFGQLLIDPTKVPVMTFGAIPVGGVAQTLTPVPNDPVLVGATVYWQALVGDPQTLTNRERTTLTAY